MLIVNVKNKKCTKKPDLLQFSYFLDSLSYSPGKREIEKGPILDQQTTGRLPIYILDIYTNLYTFTILLFYIFINRTSKAHADIYFVR